MMTKLTCYPPPLDGLLRLGDPCQTVQWIEGRPDYVTELGLTLEHVPALLEIARSWFDSAGDEQPTGDALWAPVHAWRALGQLGSAEVIEPLVAMLGPLEENGDDWYFDEFPNVLALVGPQAMPIMATYVSDESAGHFARITAAESLCRIGSRHPQVRHEAVSVLGEQLANFSRNDASFNAFLILYLMDLKAVESVELIERAYASGRVDQWIVGTWHDVRQSLGMSGPDLVPDEPRATQTI